LSESDAAARKRGETYDPSIAAHTPRDERGTGCGITAGAIKEGLAVQDDQGTDSGVVPDGAGTVTLTFPAARGQPAATARMRLDLGGWRRTRR
jgi:hypothetical protein